MQKYLGTKLIQAEPLNLGDYNNRRGWTIPENEDPAKEGYYIVYPDVYVSWSPKEIFEEAYRKTDGLSFGLAVEALKKGNKVTREGWNGKGMYLKYQKQRTLGIPLDGEDTGNMLPFIAMKVVGDSKEWGKGCIDIVPWLASQTDVLGEDWQIVE